MRRGGWHTEKSGKRFVSPSVLENLDTPTPAFPTIKDPFINEIDDEEEEVDDEDILIQQQ
jgi:hypothetical protein